MSPRSLTWAMLEDGAINKRREREVAVRRWQREKMRSSVFYRLSLRCLWEFGSFVNGSEVLKRDIS